MVYICIKSYTGISGDILLNKGDKYIVDTKEKTTNSGLVHYVYTMSGDFIFNKCEISNYLVRLSDYRNSFINKLLQ